MCHHVCVCVTETRCSCQPRQSVTRVCRQGRQRRRESAGGTRGAPYQVSTCASARLVVAASNPVGCACVFPPPAGPDSPPVPTVARMLARSDHAHQNQPSHRARGPARTRPGCRGKGWRIAGWWAAEAKMDGMVGLFGPEQLSRQSVESCSRGAWEGHGEARGWRGWACVLAGAEGCCG